MSRLNKRLPSCRAHHTWICIFYATFSVCAYGQPRAPVIVDIAPCIDVASVLERLDCYDALARAAQRDGPAAGERDGPESGGGAEGRAGIRPEPGGDRQREPSDEISSEVAALKEIVPGQLEITLTNGQVWRQTNSDRYRLEVGYPVRVYPSRFGQYYRLTSEILRGFIQVERIR